MGWWPVDEVFRRIEETLRRTQEYIRDLERTFMPRVARGVVSVGREVLTGFREPLVDVREEDDEVVVTMELPGVNKEDIRVNATENFVEVRADVRRERAEERGHYFRRERFYTGFYRRVELPYPVDPSTGKAKFENGILEIRLKKAVRERGRRIPVE